MKLHKKIILKYKLTILTGIHIGDAKENAEIGGVDSPVVRRKDNNQPYIPGSSIKGKIRSLLELAHGANTSSKFNDYPGKSVIIPHLFGATQGTETNPSRIIIRDAFLTSDAISKFGGNEFTDLPYSEVKAENSINRVRGVADHPRFIERIPAGTEFDLEMIINIFDTKQEKDFLSLLNMGITLLENDYLGGSGSRGYGQVKFTEIDKKELIIDNLLKDVG